MFLLVYFFIVFSCTFPSYAAQPVASSADDPLPGSSALTPWTFSEKPAIYHSDDLHTYINGAADLFIEFGFKQVTTCELTHREHFIVIEIYEMNDPTGAWGVYAAHKPVDSLALQSIRDSYHTQFSVVFTKSRYYVLLKSDEANQNLQTTLSQWAQIIADKIPDVPQTFSKKFKYFPEPDLVPGSYQIAFGPLAVNRIHFFNTGNILEVSRECPAAAARYKWNGTIIPVFHIEYTSEAILTSVINSLKKMSGDHPSVEQIEKGLNVIKIPEDDSFIYVVHGNRHMYIICGDPGITRIHSMAWKW